MHTVCARAGCEQLKPRYNERYCSRECYRLSKIGTVGPNAGRNMDYQRTYVCPEGHPYTPANSITWISRRTGKPGRKCKTCHREQMRRHRHPEPLAPALLQRRGRPNWEDSEYVDAAG